MGGNDFVIMLIIGCVIIAVLIMFTKPLKFLSRMLIRGVAGIAGIFAANILLAFTGITVGVNLMTVLTVCLLGIPGFIALYVAQAIL